MTGRQVDSHYKGPIMQKAFPWPDLIICASLTGLTASLSLFLVSRRNCLYFSSPMRWANEVSIDMYIRQHILKYMYIGYISNSDQPFALRYQSPVILKIISYGLRLLLIQKIASNLILINVGTWISSFYKRWLCKQNKTEHSKTICIFRICGV